MKSFERLKNRNIVAGTTLAALAFLAAGCTVSIEGSASKDPSVITEKICETGMTLPKSSNGIYAPEVWEEQYGTARTLLEWVYGKGSAIPNKDAVSTEVDITVGDMSTEEQKEAAVQIETQAFQHLQDLNSKGEGGINFTNDTTSNNARPLVAGNHDNLIVYKTTVRRDAGFPLEKICN